MHKRTGMRRCARAMIAFIVLVMAAAVASAQPAAREKEPTATIAGRITLGGKAASGVMVTLLPAEPVFRRALSVKTTTDEDGSYRFTGVAAGRYTVAPIAPSLVVPRDANFWGMGKGLTISEGEEIEGLNFTLTRGGVITGRVVDEKGNPVIEQYVNLIQVDERGQKGDAQRFNAYSFNTDDRGVYRVYGLAAGRYVVSLGEASDSGSVRFGFGGYYERTFHPNVTDQSRATIIEVKEGAEATGIDITLAVASKSFTASGRIVDADTGKPLANVLFGYGALMKDNRMGTTGWADNRTNAAGEFRLEGVTPGRYAAFIVADAESDLYSEPAPFEITNQDVKGIEIKTRRGATISGVAVFEGASDPEALARLSSLLLYPEVVKSEGLVSPRMMASKIAADGSFRVTGLGSGKVNLHLSGMPNEMKGFSVLRIERDGRDLRDGIEIGAGEQIANVRLVLAYGTSVIRGLVNIEGGELPEDLAMRVQVVRPGDKTYAVYPVMVDARRRFALEGLSAGDYDVELQVVSVDYDAPPPKIAQVKQRVTVPQSGTVDVTLTVNLAARDKDN